MRLFFLILFSFSFSFGQTINGLVLDKNTNAPIADVTIYLEKDRTGVITDKKGKFSLKIRSKIKENDTIVFSHLGHKNKYFTIAEIKNNTAAIYLQPDIERLHQVSIRYYKKLQTRIKFEELRPLEKAMFSFGSVLVNDKIYIIGGDLSIIEEAHLKIIQDDPSLTGGPGSSFGEFLQELRSRRSISNQNYSEHLYIYDIPSNTWKISKHKFRKRAYHSLNYYDHKIYVIGGKRLSQNRRHEYLEDKIEIFDLKKDTVLIEDVNPHQAVNSLSFVYKNRLIVLGGSTKLKKGKIKVYSNKVRFLNFKTGLWYELDDMPEAKELKGVLGNDKLYTIATGSGRNANTAIESYNLQTGKWQKESDLFETVYQPAMTYHNGIIYFFDEGKIYTYNTINKVLNEYLIDLFLKGSSLYCYNDTLFILGGFVDDKTIKLPSSRLVGIALKEFEKTKTNQRAEPEK